MIKEGWCFPGVLVAALFAGSLCWGEAAQEGVEPGLESLFTEGALLEDRNGDGVVDFVNARILLADGASAAEIAAGADVAMRFGFETMAMNLPIEGESATGAWTVLIGRDAVEEAGLSFREVGLEGLVPGEGRVAVIVEEDRRWLVLAGADEAGTRAAAEVFAGRLPELAPPSEPTLETVIEDVRALLARHDVSVRGARVAALHVQSGEKILKRLVVESHLDSGSDVGRASSALQSEPEALGYPGVGQLRVRLTAPGARGRDVDIAQRRILPAPGPLARRPGSGAKATLDLSSFFTPDGLLGDANDDRIPDRIDALLVPSGDGVRGTVDLAGRLGLESTGISIPAARRAEAITEPEEEPALVLIGQDHPLVRELTDRNKVVLPPLAAGEGWIQVIPKAFGDKSAVVITGGDAPSVERALRQVSERFPNIWSRGKDRTTLDGIEDDVWGFLSGRSPAGQAATALYKLEQLAKELAYKELASAEVAVYVEKAEEGLESSVRERAEQVLSADTLKVTVEDLDIQNARTLIDEDIEITSEVDDFWDLFRSRVLPGVRRNRPVVIEARLSEPPEIRASIEEQARAELLEAGAAVSGTSVTVLSAYKQGFSWLYDVVRPALANKPVERLTIRFAEHGPPEEWPYQTMYAPSRWLLEIYPIDEILARETNLELEQIDFEQMPIGSPTYEVVATGTDGSELYRGSFEPKWVLRSYFDVFPDYEKVRVTTGWLTAAVAGERVLNQRIVTDPERFWDHFQSQTLTAIYHNVMTVHKGKPRPEDAPFFGELTVDLTLSEPDYSLGVDKEHISPMESLHEEIFFGVGHFFDLLGRFTRGTFRATSFGSLSYRGRVVPIMRPKSDGKPGRAKITLTGFGSPRPGVVIDYRERNGREGHARLDIPKVALERPQALAARVRDGQNGIERLDLRLKVDSETDQRKELVRTSKSGPFWVDREFMSAQQVLAVVVNLERLRARGLYRDALAYHDLGQLRIAAGWEHDIHPDSQQVAELDPNGSAPAFPDINELLPAGDRRAGEPLVQWDTPIPPEEADAILATMSTFDEATAYWVGRSYLGQDIWAMDLMPLIEATHWSHAKATTFKPTVVYSARQHANEVSSTSHVLKLAELLLTDETFRKKLDRVNVVIHPMTNPDGARLAYELFRITPNYMLHAGRPGALGADVITSAWDDDTRIYPESRVRPDLWRTWLPDIFLNPHGMPDHEWVQLFSEYVAWVGNRVIEPLRATHWINRGWFMARYEYIDDPSYPRHKQAALDLQKRITDSINADPEIRALNERTFARFRRYGIQFDPDSFKDGRVNDVILQPDHKGVKPDPRADDFMARNPRVTIWTGVAEAPDETVSGDWMKRIANAGLQWDKAILQYLVDGNHVVERETEAFFGGIRRSMYRPRPPKSKAKTAAPTSGNFQQSSGARRR